MPFVVARRVRLLVWLLLLEGFDDDDDDGGGGGGEVHPVLRVRNRVRFRFPLRDAAPRIDIRMRDGAVGRRRWSGRWNAGGSVDRTRRMVGGVAGKKKDRKSRRYCRGRWRYHCGGEASHALDLQPRSLSASPPRDLPPRKPRGRLPKGGSAVGDVPRGVLLRMASRSVGGNRAMEEKGEVTLA